MRKLPARIYRAKSSSRTIKDITKLAGIYLHIPFCKQACNYCNFHFSTSLQFKEDLVNALSLEIAGERNYLDGKSINTIYFGGGTPSLLSAGDCASLLATVFRNFPVATDAEITLEANPDDINIEKLKGWKHAGINRLSIGIQSFFEEELKWMNRAHTREQAIGNLHLAKEQFDNISIDLIYGSPLLSDEMWRENVRTAIEFQIPHLSCYALTVEEKTPLHKKIVLQQLADVENEKQARQFSFLMQWLRDAGYKHYEVSNFAKPGYRSRHNSSYWKGEKYLGIGPSAHSYNGAERRWNIPNNNLYIRRMGETTPWRETEQLTDIQKMNEYIMISLRTSEGLDLGVIENNWGRKSREKIEMQVMKFQKNQLVKITGPAVQLTDEGFLRADGIASELFA